METTSTQRLTLLIEALITFREEASVPNGHFAPGLSRRADLIQGRLKDLLKELSVETAATYLQQT